MMATDVFAAIADPTRRAVLDLLAQGPRNAGGIAAEFPRLTQPGVSRHLRVLRKAKLVEVAVRAQQRIYTINPDGLADLYEWVAKYQAMWPDTLDSLARYLDARAVGEKAMTKAVIDGRTGGSIDFRIGPAQLHVTGRILVWGPPHVFEYEWKVKPWGRMPKGEDAIVRWELRPEGEETLLTLTHRNLTRRSALGAAPATHVVLERLVAQLAGLPFEDFRERVAQVQEQYPSRREAH